MKTPAVTAPRRTCLYTTISCSLVRKQGGCCVAMVLTALRSSAFPLSLAWLDCPPGAAAGEARGNFVAVGTMMPAIELWDLDVLDASEPVMVLGGEDVNAVAAATASKRPGAKPSKKSSRVPVLRPGSHTDAVLGVAWNGTAACCVSFMVAHF